MSDDVPEEILQTVRHMYAPEIIEKAADENDIEDLAEVAAAVTETVHEESQQRDLDKHAGIACLYLTVNHLSEVEAYEVNIETEDED